MTRATRNAGSRRVRFCPSAALTLSKSAKSLRYNFLAPVCRTCLFTSSQVDTVLDLREIESASPFEFITQTFAVFRVEVACEARSNDARDAKRMVQGRAGGAESACMAMREACGAEMRRQCAGREVRGGGACGLGEGHSNSHARSMRRRDARGLSSAWLGQSGRIASGTEMRGQCVGREARGQGRADNVVGREAHGLEDTDELQAARACRMGQGRGALQWDMWRGAAGRFGPQGARCAGGRVRTWVTTGNPTAR